VFFDILLVSFICLLELVDKDRYAVDQRGWISLFSGILLSLLSVLKDTELPEEMKNSSRMSFHSLGKTRRSMAYSRKPAKAGDNCREN